MISTRIKKRPFAAAQSAELPDRVRELEIRLGPVHARQRLGIEEDLEMRARRWKPNIRGAEGVLLSSTVIATVLRLSGLYWYGRRNTAKLRLKVNEIVSSRIPRAFDGLTLLHLSDLHTDMNEAAMARLLDLLPSLDYDICVLTGDYRGKTFGAFDLCLTGMERLRRLLRGPVYGVLGNHDSLRMVPGLEAMGIRMLMNESVVIERGGHRIHLAGIDDAHFYRVDNIEKAADAIPRESFSVLLSHTPEIYRQAAHAGFDLVLSGHTHGGQICLPGRIPLTLDAALPRSFGSGAWTYEGMAGYTSVGAGSSVVPVRFNCPPEITLHRLSSPARERGSIRPVPDREPEQGA